MPPPEAVAARPPPTAHRLSACDTLVELLLSPPLPSVPFEWTANCNQWWPYTWRCVPCCSGALPLPPAARCPSAHLLPAVPQARSSPGQLLNSQHSPLPPFFAAAGCAQGTCQWAGQAPGGERNVTSNPTFGCSACPASATARLLELPSSTCRSCFRSRGCRPDQEPSRYRSENVGNERGILAMVSGLAMLGGSVPWPPACSSFPMQPGVPARLMSCLSLPTCFAVCLTTADNSKAPTQSVAPAPAQSVPAAPPAQLPPAPAPAPAVAAAAAPAPQPQQPAVVVPSPAIPPAPSSAQTVTAGGPWALLLLIAAVAAGLVHA